MERKPKSIMTERNTRKYFILVLYQCISFPLLLQLIPMSLMAYESASSYSSGGPAADHEGSQDRQRIWAPLLSILNDLGKTLRSVQFG